jgi:hypothetical protein
MLNNKCKGKNKFLLKDNNGYFFYKAQCVLTLEITIRFNQKKDRCQFDLTSVFFLNIRINLQAEFSLFQLQP